MIHLHRFGSTPYGTFGHLWFKEFQCYTVERPWLNNRPRESCIPQGQYRLVKVPFYRGGYDCYEICTVPGRSEIKIHIGNTSEDVIGCVALGKRLGCIESRWAVLESRKAFKEFMRVLEDRPERSIDIRWVGGER